MTLVFPDLDTLRLALISGIVPAAISQAPTGAGFDDAGQVWLQPSVTPARPALADLRRLKVQTPRRCSTPLADFHCWLQVFAVQPTGDAVVLPEQAVVLFDLPADHWTNVVAEMLRLGNDRQSFRYLEGVDGARVLLRVVGPPYYTLLRALDRDDVGPGPVAYIEAAPRLWVQLGHLHPFADRIKVPEDEVLLLRPTREWSFLPDAPFREIYEALEFTLSTAPTPWREAKMDRRLEVPLRLVQGDPPATDELWVLREQPLEQLDDLVSNADDELLQQLSFAVAEKDGQTMLVLRVRPSRKPPRVPELRAVKYRTHQHLPNLFVPSGKRLHPPVSCHVVRRLLADDPAVVTWLNPEGDGSFTPECLPDDAFRPLTDWIDYILDRNRQPLQTWVQAAQFDFEHFICTEEEPADRSRKPVARRDRKGRQQEAPQMEPQDAQTSTAAAKQEEQSTEEAPEAAATSRIEPSALLQRLQEVEAKFLAVAGPLDNPERLALWPEIAGLNAALERGEDAALCWLNALWFAEKPAADWCRLWFEAEAARVPLREGHGDRSWTTSADESCVLDSVSLDRVLGLAEPASADVRALAAYVCWAAQQGRLTALLERLGSIRQFLANHDRTHLPVRAVWLAWLSLTQVSEGDVLGLARARDRLLDRLLQTGLRPEQDLPAVLRFAGGPSTERLQALRHWLIGLSELAHAWVEKSNPEAPRESPTSAYGDLMFAFGLARVGESDASKKLLASARSALGGRDEVHGRLLQGFAYRIEQLLTHKPHQGPLPADQLEAVRQMDSMPRYIVERLRQFSRILEPDQQIDAQRQVFVRVSQIHRELAILQDLEDHEEAARRMGELLREIPKNHDDPAGVRSLVLRAALDLAPRLGEEFTLNMLLQVSPVLDALPPHEGLAPADCLEAVRARAALLEKGLFAAAHFGRLEHVQALVGRFHKLLQAQRGTGSTIQVIDTLANQCFRGLRKLGLRDDIDRLLTLMADLILESQQVKTIPALVLKVAEEAKRADLSFANLVVALRALTHVAGGWYYFGRAAQADPVLNAVRDVLLQGTLLTRNQLALAKEQTPLAYAYVTALAQAPVMQVQQRLEELFRNLEVRDTWTTGAYYNLSQLRLIETVVQALNDDFTMGLEVRRWLDEDEFLVRQRIHRDLRALMIPERRDR